MRAFAIVLLLPALLPGLQPSDSTEVLLEKAQHLELVSGRIEEAIELYRKILITPGTRRSTLARALAELGRSLEKLGKPEARQTYERILREFADHPEPVAFARSRLEAMGSRVEPATRRVWVAGSSRLLKVSPDGRHVALSGYGGPLQVRDLRAGVTTSINTAGFPPAGFVTSACFSEDSKYVAYVDRVGIRPHLRLSAIENREARTLDGDWEGFVLHSWTPDGKQLLASVWQEDNRAAYLAAISVADGTRRRLTPEGRSAVEGVPSSDGRYLLYQEAADTHQPYDIFLMDLGSGNRNAIVEHPANDQILGWTPDGNGVVFASDRSGTSDIWLQAVERGLPQGSPIMVRRDLGQHSVIGLTRGGTLFQWVQAGGNDLYSATLDPDSGVLTAAPSVIKPRFPLNTRAPGDATMAWSPDGKFIVYLAKGDIRNPRSNGLITSSLETREEVRIPTRPGLFFFQPAWSPDLTRFLVNGNDESGVPAIFLIDRRTGEDRRVVDLPGGNTVTANAEWLPDGKSFVYKMRDPAKPGIFYVLARNIETGEERKLHTGFHTDSLKLSQDGRHFAFFRADPTDDAYVLMVQAVEGAEPRELHRVKRPQGFTDLAWTPDGKWLLYVLRKGLENELWRISVARGAPQRIAPLPWYVIGLCVHPNGRQIGFTRNHRSSELWLTENFLPRPSQ